MQTVYVKNSDCNLFSSLYILYNIMSVLENHDIIIIMYYVL